MSLFEKILVPVDFSGGAESALLYAKQLSATFEAQVDVLHVWKPPVAVPTERGLLVPYPEGHNAHTMAEGEAERLLELLFGKLELNADPHFRKRTQPGSVVHGILQHTEDYDLVIMTTHGRRGLSRVILGSVAEKVVRHSICPVLVVHQDRPKERG